MDRNPESPWNPRVPADISPIDFESVVLELLALAADRQGQRIASTHLGVAQGAGGAYKIDVLVTFSLFQGAEFMVLVECKHQRRPVEREDVMVLESKLRDVNAQKGMLFSTSGFQSGALEFAETKHIATITVVEGHWLYETKAAGDGPPIPPPRAAFDAYAGIRVTKTATEVSCHSIDNGRPDAIEQWMVAERPNGTPLSRTAGGGTT